MEYTPHNFRCCNTYGGSAFRKWCMLYKHKAVFIGFDNHEWIELASSDPNAEWKRGCQDSCAHGNPRPYSKNAYLLPITSLPKEFQPTAFKWVAEAKEICKEKILAQIKLEKEKKIEEENLKNKKYKEEVYTKWYSRPLFERRKMRVLNLYAGIGGNRKLWTDVEVTAVEYDPKIASIYQDFFPNDKVVVGDAHQYLLEHFTEFDFIWASPPCPTHSRLNSVFTVGKGNAKNPVQYPNMMLYQEIILLKHFFKGKWCVENVISYYEPLIRPQEVDNHYFWTNFHISSFPTGSREHYGGYEALSKQKGFCISKYSGIDKIKTLRNCVVPALGEHILNQSKINIYSELF